MSHANRVPRNWGARITEVVIHGMRAVLLENEVLRVGVNLDRGTEIFQFCHKPTDLDFCPIAPWGVTGRDLPRHAPDPRMAFQDSYPGGWQEIFPSAGAPSSHRGAALGQHDEAWQTPFDLAVDRDGEDEVAVTMRAEMRRTPFLVEKRLRLRRGEARLEVAGRVENLSPHPQEAMWAQHLAYGPPFLAPGCEIRLPDGIEAVPHPVATDGAGRRFTPDRFAWPLAAGVDGGTVDLSRVPERGTRSDLCYLSGFGPDAWYEIGRPGGEGLRVEWDASTLPYLWYWQEFGAGSDYPWYGRLYTVGLEPCSSYPTDGLGEAVANGTAMRLGPGEHRELRMNVEVRRA